MTPPESTQDEGFPTPPQGNVTQANHKHVTKQNPPPPNATTTSKRGEAAQWTGPGGLLNTRFHKVALATFLFVVLAHWAEHILQAVQIYVLGWPRPEAGGLLGLAFPVLVSSEWLHYGFAILMLTGFVMLRHGFTGRGRTWWNVAMWIQVWHHFEHLLLLLQALTGAYLMGAAVPTSVVQLVTPRVELHLFYNAVVFAPMVVAMLYHRRPRVGEVELMRCTCARVPAPAAA